MEEELSSYEKSIINAKQESETKRNQWLEDRFTKLNELINGVKDNFDEDFVEKLRSSANSNPKSAESSSSTKDMEVDTDGEAKTVPSDYNQTLDKKQEQSAITNYKNQLIPNTWFDQHTEQQQSVQPNEMSIKDKRDQVLFKQKSNGKPGDNTAYIPNRTYMYGDMSHTYTTQMASTITRKPNGSYRVGLCIKHKTPGRQEVRSIEKIKADDQGSNTFGTIYDPINGVIKLGDGFARRVIIPRVERINRLADRIKFGGGTIEKKTNMARNLRRLRQKLKFIIAGFHRNVIHAILGAKTVEERRLGRGYIDVRVVNDTDAVILPRFAVKKMIGPGSVLSERVKLELQYLSFYAFRTRMHNACKKYSVHVVQEPEPFTSKTCIHCHLINKDHTAKQQIFDCKFCNESADHDSVGSANIFIKAVSRLMYENNARFKQRPSDCKMNSRQQRLDVFFA
eukprot:TRINITY_DN65_c0_g1_i1.p1 TRINITY_DN65_c0_g1~~TRINITY_DN65_c0_g1_i1.p1  ORF type:complete len:464 (+),score=121.56 TRINITY_DN65_c0_g1_i1:35-1393(+)